MSILCYCLKYVFSLYNVSCSHAVWDKVELRLSSILSHIPVFIFLFDCPVCVFSLCTGMPYKVCLYLQTYKLSL